MKPRFLPFRTGRCRDRTAPHPARRIESVELSQQFVQPRVRVAQLDRAFEEILGGDGEELSLVFRGVGIKEHAFAAVHGIEQCFELGGKVVGPLGDGSLTGAQAEAFGVEVVCKLVQRDVVALAGMARGLEHVFPREDDAARLPGFAREHSTPLLDDAGLVLDLVLHPEGRRIHEHRVQLVVMAATAQHQHAGHRRDGGAHLVGDDEPVAADECLLGDEHGHQRFEPRPQLGRQVTHRWHVVVDGGERAGR